MTLLSLATVEDLAAAVAEAVLAIPISTAAGNRVEQVNGASVAHGAYTVLNPTATNGKRFALFTLKSDKAWGYDFWGHRATFSTIATAKDIDGKVGSGLAANSTTGGKSVLVCCAGHAFVGGRLLNSDGADAAIQSVILEALFD